VMVTAVIMARVSVFDRFCIVAKFKDNFLFCLFLETSLLGPLRETPQGLKFVINACVQNAAKQHF